MLYSNHMTNKNNQDWEINEKDIDGVLNYLRTNVNKDATPEMAIAILEHMQATYHQIGHDDPDLLEKIYNELIE